MLTKVRDPFLSRTPETKCPPCSRDPSHNCPTPLASKDLVFGANPPCCAAQVTGQPVSNPLLSGAKRAEDAAQAPPPRLWQGQNLPATTEGRDCGLGSGPCSSMRP